MEVHPIDYAPPIPFLQQRRAQRFIALSLVLLACVAIGARVGPGAWDRIELLYWQRQALRYAAPPGQDEHLVQAWLRFSELAAPPGRRERPVLFLHERTNSRGESRLVAVEGGAIDQGACVTVFQPGSLFGPPVEVSSDTTRVQLNAGNPHVRWFAGQVDTSDGSHFTIAYDCDGKRNVIDGWLHDNDTVTLEPRR